MQLGIDIGGTTISAGLAQDRRIIRRTDGPSFPASASLQETIEILAQRMGELLVPEVESIGIGVPSVVDTRRGIVYDAANIPAWQEVPLKDVLEARFGLPVYLDNDANCYALGAVKALKAEREILVAVTLGTGVGVGIVQEGHILRGRCCGAGELCCLPYQGSVIEDFTSSKFFASQGTSGAEAARALARGDVAAQALFDAFGAHLGRLVSVVLYAYDPHRIVFGGGIARAFPAFEAALWRELKACYAYPSQLSGLRIEAYTDPDTALLGAASL